MSFVLFKRHVAGGKRLEAAAWALGTFYAFVAFHIKCSKASHDLRPPFSALGLLSLMHRLNLTTIPAGCSPLRRHSCTAPCASAPGSCFRFLTARSLMWRKRRRLPPGALSCARCEDSAGARRPGPEEEASRERLLTQTTQRSYRATRQIRFVFLIRSAPQGAPLSSLSVKKSTRSHEATAARRVMRDVATQLVSIFLGQRRAGGAFPGVGAAA